MTQSLKKAAQSKAIEDYKRTMVRRRVSLTSVSSSATLTSETLATESNACSSMFSETSDHEIENYTDATEYMEDAVIHAIIIPNYKEEMDTLKETLDVLASHSQARNCYDVYLGMEQREVESESKALKLIHEFVNKFRSIDFSIHPADIPGEAAGKGSNLAWAARKLSVKYSMGMRQNVIVTGIDADSHLSSSYFTSITSMHHAHPDTASTTLYAAPIIFDRNAHAVPAIVRVADILWCAAGISGLYKGSVIAPPTSVYSLPLILVDRVGGWDCDAEAIGEDLHMYIKCFFALNGNLTCRTVLSPVSQSNVTGGGKGGIRGAVKDIKARYKQALRHMWGALDTGFALREAAEMWKERKRTTRTFRPLHSQGNESSLYIPDIEFTSTADVSAATGIFSDLTQDTIKEPHLEKIFYLFHRLFEAHFLPVHMTILVFASALYVWFADGNGDPHNVAWIFAVSNMLRTMGFMGVACYLFLYESYHRICVAAREKEMTRAKLADGMCFSHRSVRKNFIDYILVPVVAPLYGAIPCAQAEICHLWTVNLVYAVSKKVTRQRARSKAAMDMA
ncbi:sphingomyelinase family, partial [Metarhizium majus ARSEF 297]